MGRRGRYSEARKQEVLAEWGRSRLSPIEFAKRQGRPSAKTMLGWVREAKAQPFLPVRVQGLPQAPSPGSVRVDFGPVRIELDAGIDVDWLAALVRGLQ